MKASAVVLAVVAAAAPARAQSRRYPAAPIDRDDASHSRLWDRALDPKRGPYDELVARAKRQLGDHPTPDQAKAAIEGAARAIALAADRPDAYVVRGEAELAIAAWPGCADDLAAAADRASARPADAPTDLAWNAARARELGICQARAGRYADAERTLAATTSASAQGELLMRLGEVRIAMGKLDEAIDALHAASEQVDRAQQAMIDWLLALAYDRARRPEDSDAAAQRASQSDRDHNYSLLENPQLPFLGAGEKEYLLGLAYRSDRAPGGAFKRVEHALLYFRRFLALAPADSPWRRRAEEHARELAAVELPQTIDRVTGSAALDRRRGSPPPPGVTILPRLNLVEVERDVLDAATRCLEPIVNRIALPVPKDRDLHYVAAFVVIAP